jgi:hypothetical protein
MPLRRPAMPDIITHLLSSFSGATFAVAFSSATLGFAFFRLASKILTTLRHASNSQESKHVTHASITIGNVRLEVRTDDPESVARVLREVKAATAPSASKMPVSTEAP